MFWQRPANGCVRGKHQNSHRREASVPVPRVAKERASIIRRAVEGGASVPAQRAGPAQTLSRVSAYGSSRDRLLNSALLNGAFSRGIWWADLRAGAPQANRF